LLFWFISHLLFLPLLLSLFRSNIAFYLNYVQTSYKIYGIKILRKYNNLEWRNQMGLILVLLMMIYLKKKSPKYLVLIRQPNRLFKCLLEWSDISQIMSRIHFPSKVSISKNNVDKHKIHFLITITIKPKQTIATSNI